MRDILKTHTGDSEAGTVNIFKLKTGAKQFEPLALINFKTTALKYTFEREFAIWKRGNPAKNEKLTISRAPPAKTPGEEFNDKPMDIRRQIAGFYHISISQAQAESINPNVHIHKKITEEQITAMSVQLKAKHKPLATYWEFLDPTKNIT